MYLQDQIRLQGSTRIAGLEYSVAIDNEKWRTLVSNFASEIISFGFLGYKCLLLLVARHRPSLARCWS